MAIPPENINIVTIGEWQSSCLLKLWDSHVEELSFFQLEEDSLRDLSATDKLERPLLVRVSALSAPLTPG